VGSNSRYDRTAKVGGREADEARALHVIADLLDDYPGIDPPVIPSRLRKILRPPRSSSTPAGTCRSGSDGPCAGSLTRCGWRCSPDLTRLRSR
jgi:hypothetical protein